MKSGYRIGHVAWAAVLLLASGCGQVVEDEASKRVNALLPKYLGPARRYATQVRGDSAGAVLRGRLRSVHVTGEHVQLEPNLFVEELKLNFEEVEVDTKAQTLRNVGSATFFCRIGEADLDRYIRARRTDIEGLRVALKGNAIVVNAAPNALGLLAVPISVQGRLVPHEGAALDFIPDRARLSIVPIPQVALDFLARRLNPVVDLSNVAVPIQVTRAEIRSGALELSGAIRPEDVLRLASPAPTAP